MSEQEGAEGWLRREESKPKDKQPEILTKASENHFFFHILYLFFPNWSWKQTQIFKAKDTKGDFRGKLFIFLKSPLTTLNQCVIIIKPYKIPIKSILSSNHYKKQALVCSTNLYECTQKGWVLIQSLLRFSPCKICRAGASVMNENAVWKLRTCRVRLGEGTCPSNQTKELPGQIDCSASEYLAVAP